MWSKNWLLTNLVCHRITINLVVCQSHLQILTNLPFLGLIQCPVIIKLDNQALWLLVLTIRKRWLQQCYYCHFRQHVDIIGGNENYFVVQGYAKTRNILYDVKSFSFHYARSKCKGDCSCGTNTSLKAWA